MTENKTFESIFCGKQKLNVSPSEIREAFIIIANGFNLLVNEKVFCGENPFSEDDEIRVNAIVRLLRHIENILINNGQVIIEHDKDSKTYIENFMQIKFDEIIK